MAAGKEPAPPKSKKQGGTYDGITLKPNPEADANFLSKISFFFMTHLFSRGWNNTLEQTDIFEPLPEHESNNATVRLGNAWRQAQLRAARCGKKPSLYMTIFREYGWDIALLGILLFVEEAIHVMQPIFMGKLIRFFRYDSPTTIQDAYIAALGVSITAACVAVIHHPYFYGLQKIGLQIKIAASGLIMEKGVRLSSAALHKTTVGHMVNLLSTDVMKFDMGFIFFHYLWVAPILLVAYGYLIWSEIGVSTVAGFGAFVLLFPVQAVFSKMMGKCKREIAVRTDKRISIMNEILNGIRVIKMYAWEDAFADIVANIRQFEMKKIRENAIHQSVVMGLFWPSGKLVVLFAAVCYVWSGNPLTSERIFVATALFNSCRLPLMLFLPISLQFLYELKVSCRRIQEFLELEDFSVLAIENDHHIENGYAMLNGKNGHQELIPLKKNAVESIEDTFQWAFIDNKDCADAHIYVENLTTTWNMDDDTERTEATYAIKDVTFEAERGQLIGVIGPVGAGKSSLLESILREAKRVDGSLHVKGSVAYCSQDAWIFGGSVRDNVVFGRPFNLERYETALEKSALKTDVESFPQGDLTLVGDRGTSLSGGQKARVALARALYSNANIFLLDDPLSAVDTAVGRFLFEECILGHLKDRVVILVTHQLQFLGKADLILVMKEGKVAIQGTPADLKKTNSKLVQQLIHETSRSYARAASESSDPTTPMSSEFLGDLEPIEEEITESSMLLHQDSVISSAHPMDEQEKVKVPTEEEEKSEGAVSWRIYGIYIMAMLSNPCTVPPAVIVTVFVQLLFNLTDYWLNKWTNASEKAVALLANNTISHTRDYVDSIGYGDNIWNIDLDDYMKIFAILTIAVVILSVIRCLWIRVVQTIASEVLHRKMFDSIVNANIHFFDKNPIGRILNRFSKDVHTMDEALAFVFFEFVVGLLSIIGTVVMIVALNPMILVPTTPLVILFFLLRMVYLASSRDVKRLEATTRSPLYSHISAVMQGLITVRAFGNQDSVIKTYHDRMNINSSAFLLTVTTSRWFAVQIDWLVALFVSAVAFACVFTTSVMTSGEVALMLVYAVQLTGFFSWIMRQSAELQNGMVSVERITNYTELPSEHARETPTHVPNGWPSTGQIKIDHMSLKYDEDGDYVLRDINLLVKPKEKIGIVGRTGAGKSSLLRALFRLTNPCEGTVYIDGVNTASLPLKDLRKSIAIIPQEPVLFVGSIRRNLDPFDEYTDAALWSALEQVELKQTVSELSGGLRASMQEGGVNFSVGQRQLVCLARAILRHSHILVIDEATANVDPQTDALIQRTIRLRFRESTVLTIAHRLHTIMDSDRVLVLEAGSVAEFDHAHNLLKESDTIFWRLVNETGPAAPALINMAAEAYHNLTGEQVEIAQ